MSYLALFKGYLCIVDNATAFYCVLCAAYNPNYQFVGIHSLTAQLISFCRPVNHLHLLLRLGSKHQQIRLNMKMLILLKLQLTLDTSIALIGQLQLLALFEDIFQRGKAILQILGGDIDIDQGDIRSEGDLEDMVAINDVLKRQRDGS